MAKRARLWALLIALAFALTGCLPSQLSESPAEIDLPEPAEEAVDMFLGEQLPTRLTSVSLYYAMSDGAGFSTVNLGIRADVSETLIEAAVNALLSPASGEEMVFATGDTRLLSCEFACGIATVNLSIDARNVQTEQELLALLTAIGNTLLGIDGVRGVNVLIGDESESFGQLPMGVQTAIIPSVTASYAQLLAERDHLQSGGAMPVTRNAALYFPTTEGNWLEPELREISFENDDFAAALNEALKAGPRDEACAIAAIPAAAELLDPAPRIQTLSSGEHALTLNFSGSLSNYLAFSGLDAWELAGSVALTACSFLPELDAVRIQVNGEPVTRCAVGDTELTFEDGLIRRADFSSRVGSVATLYLADRDRALRPVRRAVSMHTALSPRNLLIELFNAADADLPLRFPVPDGVFSEDLLGIRVSGGVARLNLSGNFYRRCQSMGESAERCLVYAMVNTLCQLDNISAVRFYVEGIAAETLAGHVYLRSPLLWNPGIVVAPEATGEP